MKTRGVKIDQLPTFDIEYLFLNIRAKSVGETVKVLVTCPDDMETQVPVEIDIESIQVQKSDDHTVDIEIDDQYKLRMKYPSLEQFVNNNFTFTEEDDVFAMVIWHVLISSMMKKLHMMISPRKK